MEKGRLEQVKNVDNLIKIGTRFESLKYKGLFYNRAKDKNYFGFAVCIQDTEIEVIYLPASKNLSLVEKLIESTDQLTKTDSWKRKNDLMKNIHNLEKRIIKNGRFY